MSLFWYPEINEKYAFDDMPDKGMLLSSYIRYYLARLQSMFKYENLPDTIPAKWLENYLLVNGFCVWIKDGEDLIVTYAGVGADPDVYYIPTKAIVTNPYVKNISTDRTYTRDEDCVVMVNDTYAQGLLPMLKKYCAQMVEIDVSFYLNTVMSRGTAVLSATDDNTKASAELWLKHIKEGKLGVIGESNFTLEDRDLTVNQLSGTDGTLTNLIEAMQYVKASLYNELGLQANYNMKREAINSGESQLTEDQLHPLIDNMLKERQEAIEKVNAMFGTDIKVSFNSAWEINEREEEAAIEQIEATTEQTEAAAEMAEEAPANEEVTEDITTNEDIPEEAPTEEVTEEDAAEEAPEVEVTISDDAIEEIAEKEKMKMKQIKNSLIIDNNLFTAFNNPLWEYAFPDTTELDTYFIHRYGDRIASKVLEHYEGTDGTVTGANLTALANMVYNVNKVKWQHLFDIYNIEYNPSENTDYTETFTEHSDSTGHSESENGVTYQPGTTATNKKNGFNGGSVTDTQTVMSGSDQTDSDGSADTSGTVDHNSELRKHGNIGTVDVTDMLRKSADFWKWSFIDAVCRDICDIIALSIY